MMLAYTGNAAYCYANSLSMVLRGAGMPPDQLPDPGTLECLTLMPFGVSLLRLDQELVFLPGNINVDPDQGLTLALGFLGWVADERYGGSAEEALARLRQAAAQAPVLVGPLDMAYLKYVPWYADLEGEDHFVVVLAVREDHILVHDPIGYPFATLPIEEFMAAWQAERIRYGRKPYMMHANLRQVEQVSRAEIIHRASHAIHEGAGNVYDGPVLFGGIQALRMVIEDLCGSQEPTVTGNLAPFALPLGARRSMDGSLFLREAGQHRAADLMEQRAMLYGEAQFSAVQADWAAVAGVFEQMVEVEAGLLEAL